MTLDSWPGTTTLGWHVTNDGSLTLTFVTPLSAPGTELPQKRSRE